MADIIHLLPDAVANQIAAGEVIQRPASAVKELLENSIDAGSTRIQLIIKDAGRTLIQVIDNGSGMSETDARMCFERHATSKIKSAEDLFSIRTKGFRGEAMASIAGVAQVELKSKRPGSTLGTLLEIEGSEVKSQSPCSCPEGTSISVKNLFFNIPARRNFLKSDNVEFRHILDEFQRVALAHPEIAFALHHNNSELYHLEKGTLRQRIVGMFGESYNPRLVPVEENTTIVNVSGFIGKPEFARKTRGEQFFFVNNRFIKSAYLHHAVQNAYEQLLPNDSFPSYFIFLEIDPKSIDVNIHPTKTEIKFEDERSVYTIIRAAVKQSLGKYNISPSLDFNQETAIELPPMKSREEILMNPPTIKINKNYNPFEVEERMAMQRQSRQTASPAPVQFKPETTDFLPGRSSGAIMPEPQTETEQVSAFAAADEKAGKSAAYQLHNRYILAHIKTGMIVIDQQAAHERILFEQYRSRTDKHAGGSQQKLFPQTLEYNPSDAEVIRELNTELHSLGFDLNEFGKNTFILHGTPADLGDENASELIEKIIEEYRSSQGSKTLMSEMKKDLVARSLAKNLSVKAGEVLTQEEMDHMVDSLFACQQPYASPSGKPTLITIGLDELDKKFKK